MRFPFHVCRKMSFKLFGLGKLKSFSRKKGSLRRCCHVFGSKSMGIVFGFRSGTKYSPSHNKIQSHISSQVCHHSLLFFFGPLSDMISPPNKNIQCFLCGYGYGTALFPGDLGAIFWSKNCDASWEEEKLFVFWLAECMDDFPWKGEQWPREPRGNGGGKPSLHGVSIGQVDGS